MSNFSSFVYAEFIGAVGALLWGMVLFSMTFAPTFSSARLFFALLALISGSALLVAQLPWIKEKLARVPWNGSNGSIHLRWILHVALMFLWLLCAIAIFFRQTIPPVHGVGYLMLGFIELGHVFRLGRVHVPL